MANIDPRAQIHPSVIIEGNVTVGPYTKIFAGTVLSGTVTIGHHCCICCNVVIRGRNNIGNYVHIYDLVNIEGGRPGPWGGNTCKEADKSIIGDYCWINHGAIMHGSQMGEGAVLDLNACLDYNCRIGKGAIVANGSAVRFNSEIPDNCLAEGIPATVVKTDITDEDRKQLMGLVPREWANYIAEKYERTINEAQGKSSS
jgi:carbonic anhydrase/acetyltransferase-like protein (isoleucine patch superfamily)